MTHFNTELLQYDHDLHAFVVEAEQRYQRSPIGSVPLAQVTEADGTTSIIAFDEAAALEAQRHGAEIRGLVRPAVPFAAIALLLAEAFVAGQRHPSTSANYTVQHSRWTTATGTEHEEWDVANRAEVVARCDNEAEAIAKARELNGADTCDACESFMLLAAQAEQSIA